MVGSEHPLSTQENQFWSIKMGIDKKIKEDLARAYRFLARLDMDDLTYTHLSARSPGSSYYFMYPLGFLFSEVTDASLLKISLEAEVLEGTEVQYNKTGYVLHSSIYQSRPDINAIFHLHTPAGVAVACMECGLLPISQFSFHFYNRLSYHNYHSLALDENKHGKQLANDLGQNKAMILRNHGTLTCGGTIHEAFFYSYYLEQACKVQCLALNSQQPLVYPSSEICEQAARDMQAFESDLGYRDWQALCRRFEETGK
jgi:ribulose-5-phosphate 4-epimerase/fuculose-1-phosphate aldolase